MTLVAPGVPATDVVTAPFESSVSAWPAASSWPPSTIFLKVARVPDDAGRMIRTIAWSGPPTSFQFVVLPVQMSVACWVVRLVTPVTLGLLTITQPCLAMMWSTSWEASSGLSLSSALTSLSPMFTAPWRTCVSPVPDPPPWTLTVEPAQAAAYCFPAASTTGWSAVDPAAVVEPVTHAGAAMLPAGDTADDAPAVDPVVRAGVAPAPELHAATTSHAAMTSGPTRFELESMHIPPGWARPTVAHPVHHLRRGRASGSSVNPWLLPG